MFARTMALPGTSATAAKRPSARTSRRRVAAGGLALLAFTGVGIAGASAASAAGPYTLYPNQSAAYPTWAFWGTTTLCATNYDDAWGEVAVVPQFPGAPSEDMWAAPGGTTCIGRQWGGTTIMVRNTGPVRLDVYTQ